MPNNAKITALGNLIKDPEKNTVNGNTVITFTIAVSTTLKKQNEEGFEPNFYNVSVWGKPAEYLYPKLQKGTQVWATGDLVAQPYTNKKTGAAGQSLNIKASAVEALNRLKPAPQRSNTSEDSDELIF